MPRILRAALGASVLTACFNEAHSTMMRVMSKEEIMNKTTVDSAMKLVLGLNGTAAKPGLASLLESKVRHGTLRKAGRAGGKAGSNLRASSGTALAVSDYNDIAGALDMLDEMMLEAQNKLDLEVSGCAEFNDKQMGMMVQARNDVATFNEEANTALGEMLDAQGKITSLSNSLEELQTLLEQHNKQCEDDITETRALLAIVTADVETMDVILNMTECPTSFIQTGASSSGSKHALVNCEHCLNGKGMVMLQNPRIQPLLNSLKSAYAHQCLQKELKDTFRKFAMNGHPISLASAGLAKDMRPPAGHAVLPALLEVGKLHRRHRRSRRNDTELESSASSVDVSDVPDEPQEIDCVPDDKCVLGNGTCEVLTEKFQTIRGGIEDKMVELQGKLGELEEFCETTRDKMETQIADLDQALGEEQAALAKATGEKTEAEAGSHDKADLYEELHTEYTERMTECCDNQNALKSERCALEKIKGELMSMEGTELFVDCEVGDWVAQECTLSCGTGSRLSTREVLQEPSEYGAACPALEKTEVCNDFECPVDCVLNAWEEWGACSVECGGGERTRSRSIAVHPAYGGEACAALSDTEICNGQACDADCVLTDWTPWGTCSKACSTGHQKRTRDVDQPARGTGTCPEAESDERLQFMQCNTRDCEQFLPVGRDYIVCSSKVDIIIALDGSAAWTTQGWIDAKTFTQRIIQNLQGGDETVRAALIAYGRDPDFVSRLTTDTASLATQVPGLALPGQSAETSKALQLASAELLHGRADANAIVIVITDGPPKSVRETEEAAILLKQKARILWVPVGPGAPRLMINRVVGLPKWDNIVDIPAAQSLTEPAYVNDVIADTCPIIS